MSEPVTGELVTRYQQDDLKLLLESDDLFNNVTVITEDEGDIEAQMNKALGFYATKDGARGVCVIIQQPAGGDERPGISRGPLDLEWTLLVLEHRTFNKDTAKGGTGKKAWTVARRIHRILKNHRAGGLTMNFSPAKPKCIVPAAASIEIGGRQVPLVAYEVRFHGPEADTTVYTNVANPVVSAASISTDTGTQVGTAGDTVTITCATSGADVYYTTDISHPCSQNANATLYTVPFVVPAGVLRVRAHKAGSIGSDTVAVQFN